MANSSDQKTLPSVAIIGAGIAGLSAAKSLMQQGINVTLFEKSRGLGGRASTRRLPWANLDLGVQYFTVQTPEFAQQVSKWKRQKKVAQWSFTPLIFTGISLKESPDQQKRMVATPNMGVLCHEMATSIPVIVSQRVLELISHPKGWQLITENDHFEYFDWVISAIPYEQAQPLLNPHSSLLHVRQPLHRSVWAVALATEGVVPLSVQGVFCEGDIRWVSRASAKPGFVGKTTLSAGNLSQSGTFQDAIRQNAISQNAQFDDVWILHFDESWSEKMGKETSAETIIEYAFQYLKKLLRHATDSDISLIHSDSHFWRYAQIRKPLTPSLFALSDDDKRLSATGAWCGGGRFEEGYISGITAAKAIYRKMTTKA